MLKKSDTFSSRALGYLPVDKMGEDDRWGFLKGLGLLTTLGITLVVSTFVGLLIGVYLDRFFSTKPLLTIVFLILGIIAGIRNIFVVTRRYGFRDPQDKEP